MVNPNRVRRELEAALAALKLFSTDRAERLQAVAELKEQADEGKLALFEKAEKTETDPEIRAALAMLKASALIASSRQDSSAWPPPSCWPTATSPPPRACCWNAWQWKTMPR